MQLNLILTCAIEIPGGLTSFLALDRIGRKATICCGLFFSSFCNLVLVFISKELYALHLLVFLLVKFGISTVMTSLNLYTSELFPTEFRHSLFGFCPMIGSIGSITAPLTQSLRNYWHGIPSMLFCVMGILGGLLVFTQPETVDTKLPDTVAEAEVLGKKDSRLKESR